MNQKQMNKEYFYIAKLISQYLSESIDDEQLLELNNWRNENTKNEALFQKLTDNRNFEKYSQESQKFNKNEAWNNVNSRIRFFRRKDIIKNVLKYAAVLLIPISVATFLLISKTESDDETFAGSTEKITPGEKKAILTLADGERLDLQNIKSQKLTENDGTSLFLDSVSLNYQATDKKTEKELFNKLDIPRGGEYVLTLSDGTKVHINSMSSLRFPVNFIADKRIVELEGEAYFQVAENKKPFVVKLNGMEVEVLGTTFNVSAYENEEYQTTLVSGTVKVASESGISKILHPSEQASYTKGSEDISVRKVDVSLYTSWINGKIYSKDRRLEDIMKSLSRWYDMEVVYEPESLKNLKFGCNINRYEEIAPFLELLHATEKVDIEVKNKQIIIKPNK